MGAEPVVLHVLGVGGQEGVTGVNLNKVEPFATTRPTTGAVLGIEDNLKPFTGGLVGGKLHPRIAIVTGLQAAGGSIQFLVPSTLTTSLPRTAPQ